MARITRVDVGGEFYHVINRANAKMKIFFEDRDYQLFEAILMDGVKKYDMRILAYCIMPNHFHLVLHPKEDRDIQKFMQWVTLTHTQRWHVQNNTVGTGHLYQGRYKSFLIKGDNHLLSVIRYVERNPLRANLVHKLENWHFSSLSKWLKNKHNTFLAKWPIDRPDDYINFVNTPLTNIEEESIRYSVQRGKPYGEERWVEEKIVKYKLQTSVRKRGRPRKGT